MIKRGENPDEGIDTETDLVKRIEHATNKEREEAEAKRERKRLKKEAKKMGKTKEEVEKTRRRGRDESDGIQRIWRRIMEIGVGVVIYSRENSSFHDVFPSHGDKKDVVDVVEDECVLLFISLSSSILYRHLTNARRGRGGYLSNSPFASSRTRFERSTDRP